MARPAGCSRRGPARRCNCAACGGRSRVERPLQSQVGTHSCIAHRIAADAIACPEPMLHDRYRQCIFWRGPFAPRRGTGRLVCSVEGQHAPRRCRHAQADPTRPFSGGEPHRWSCEGDRCRCAAGCSAGGGPAGISTVVGRNPASEPARPAVGRAFRRPHRFLEKSVPLRHL